MITTFDDLITTPGTKKIFLAEIEPSEHITDWTTHDLVTDGLIGFWNLNEGEGAVAADSSGYENDGTLEGSAPTWTTGISGNCVNLPGTDERVDCGNGAPLDDLGNGDFSISFWMKSKDAVPLTYGKLFYKHASTDERILIDSNNIANQLRFFMGKTGIVGGNFSVTTTPFDTEWNHIVIIVNRTTDLVLLYMNTVKDGTEIDISSLPTDCSNAARVSWGARSDGVSPYEGIMDEYRIYNRVLTEAEIGELYNLPRGSAYRNQIGTLDVQTVTEEGEDLTEVTDLADLGVGEWFYDNGYLYVEVTTSSIYQKDIVANYKMYFATDSNIIFNHKYYEPLILGIPSISQAKIDLFWGISIISDGQISFYNHDRFFDTIYERLAWSNKNITVLLGGEDLPYSEYTAMFTGKILDKHLGTQLFDVSFIDRKRDLETNIPNNTFTKTAYPNLDSEDVGKPIPLTWGTVYRMPVVNVMKGKGSATTTWLFKLADTSTHGIQAVNQIYIDGVAKAHTSADVLAATFKLSSTVYSVGQIVTADISGYQSGTTLIENPVEITKELIALVGDAYNDTNYDTSTVSAAIEESGDFPIGLVVSDYRPIIDILGDVMRSCLGTLYVNNAGQYAITIWNTDIPADLDEITEIDILGGTLKATAKHDEIRKKILVGWRKNWEKDTHSYETANATITEWLHGITRTRTVPTLLSTSAGAVIYASRMQLMLQNATIEIAFSTKLQLALKNIGNRITLTYKRRDADNNIEWLDSKVVEIQSIEKKYQDGKVIIATDDLKGIGLRVGRWTSDTPTFPASHGGGSAETWDPNWSVAQKAYAKQTWGYFTDDDGFIDPSDSDSWGYSLWW